MRALQRLPFRFCQGGERDGIGGRVGAAGVVEEVGPGADAGHGEDAFVSAGREGGGGAGEANAGGGGIGIGAGAGFVPGCLFGRGVSGFEVLDSVVLCGRRAVHVCVFA